MIMQMLLGALLAFAVAASAQPAETKPPLVNNLPFPLVTPEKAQQLAIPQPLKLDFDDAALSTVLDELKKQSGVAFVPYPGNDYTKQLATKLSIHLETPAFERAFKEIMDEAGLKAQLQNWGGDQDLKLVFGAEDDDAQKPLQSGVGLFEIELSNLSTTFSKSVNLRNSQAPERAENRNLSGELTLQTDRRLPIIGSPQARVTRAQDEEGRSLLREMDENERAQNRPNRYSFYSNSSWQQKQATLSLNPPAADAVMLANLEGVVIYAVVTKTEKWEVPDLLKAPQWTRSFESGGETIAFKIEATRNEDASQGGLKLKIEADSSDEEQSYERIGYPFAQVEPIMSAIRIEDANGVVLKPNGYNSTGGKNTVIRSTFLPENPQTDETGAPQKLRAPFRFVMSAPIEIVQTQVPFSFTNVPLP